MIIVNYILARNMDFITLIDKKILWKILTCHLISYALLMKLNYKNI